MAKRQTREERAAEAQAQRNRETIDSLKKRITEARATRVYSRERTHERSAQALYELVHEFERAKERQLRNIERLRERLQRSVERLNENDSANHYSTMVGDIGADIERDNASMEALRSSVLRLAWATDWYVPQVMTDRQRRKHDLLASISVLAREPYGLVDAAAGTPGCTFVVVSDQNDTRFYLSLTNDPTRALVALDVDRERAQRYDTEDAAWLSAVAFLDHGGY